MMTRREFVASGAAALAVAHGSGQQAAVAATIRAAGAASGLPAGCAVAVQRLRTDTGYRKLLQAQAGIVVAENEFKFGALRPSPTKFFFDDADYLAQFAKDNAMLLRGHNFVWHRSLPHWFEGYVTADNARQLLVEHIEKVGGRYAGRIHSWDVVNEAIELKDGLPGGFRNSPWQKVLGGSGAIPEYIELAYRTARRVDPKALLVYNDYGIEGQDDNSSGKRAAVLALLQAMQDKNIPIDALGVQSHVSSPSGMYYGNKLMGMVAKARGMGLKVLITEMDVNDRRLPPPIEQRDAAVAATYASYLKLVLADPAVIAMLTWGITDRYTWLDSEDSREDKLPERPLPFDDALKPKPAFDAVVTALREAGAVAGRGASAGNL